MKERQELTRIGSGGNLSGSLRPESKRERIGGGTRGDLVGRAKLQERNDEWQEAGRMKRSRIKVKEKPSDGVLRRQTGRGNPNPCP